LRCLTTFGPQPDTWLLWTAWQPGRGRAS